MRFETSSELRVFADSVRGAVAGWKPPREPAFGTWWDEHDEELAVQLRELGWAELWSDEELIGAAVAGGIELGRAVAPLSLVDQPTLGGALCVGGRARHVTDRYKVALVTGQGVMPTEIDDGVQEPTLDGTGTVRGETAGVAEALVDSNARLRLWGVTSLGYLAGLARASFDATVAYVTSREQFGAPLSSLPTMQARLADAALAVDGLELLAWEAAAEDSLPRESLAWAATAAREVTASAHQAHGAVGFALESGVHVAYRRAKSSQVWIAAVLATVRGPGATRLRR